MSFWNQDHPVRCAATDALNAGAIWQTAAAALLKEAASHKYSFCDSVAWQTPPPGPHNNLYVVPKMHRKRTKGIPALHWTTVHSAFGNRDVSQNKSFPAAPSLAVRENCKPLASRATACSSGLFDPTLRSNQLEADERRRILKQRLKLRHIKQQSLRHPAQSPPSLLVRGQANTPETDSLCHSKHRVYSQRQVKQDGTFAELVLSAPTLREILASGEEVHG